MSQASLSSQDNDRYPEFEGRIASRIAVTKGPLFIADVAATELWTTYLMNIPAHRRQHYDCRTCRHFVEHYGALVTVDNFGLTESVVWGISDVPPFFHDVAKNLRALVERRPIFGVFLTDGILGKPYTGMWTHLHGTPGVLTSKKGLQTLDQMMAAKSQDFGMLTHALRDYTRSQVDQAVRILKSENLQRSEKAVGIAQWFLEVQTDVQTRRSRVRDNVIWKYVALAPPGFCNIRSTMISTLLDDIVAGMPFEVIKRRWTEKMHPLQYQRPTAAPAAGAIDQAEKIVEKMGLAPSLQRRYANIGDVTTLWVPPKPKESPSGGGVFGHLRTPPVKVPGIDLPAMKITFSKFLRLVIPEAFAMEVYAPPVGSYYGLTTAVDLNAPPILQWDDASWRNPVAWYFYHSGSYASNWNVSVGWNQVTGVFLSPHQWRDPDRFKHMPVNVHFAIKGAKDVKRQAGLALFPETLRSELHGIRSVIEAHARTGKIVDVEGEQANGLAFSGTHGSVPVRVRVTTAGGRATYIIDRMD